MFPDPALSRRARWIDTAAFAICLLFLVTWSINVIALAIDAGYDFDGEYADGPFQIFNPLRRLAAGQVAGHDFQFFHGIYVPLVHYPLFALLGKTLTASEVTRRVLSPIGTMLVLLVGWRWVTGRWKTTMFLTAASLLLLDQSPLRIILYAYGSVLPIRTLAPLLACAAFALPVRPVWAGILAGFFAGASLLLGSEQGIALLLAAGLVGLLEVLPGGKREARIALLAAAATAVATVAVLLAIATHGDSAAMRAILKYNFREVPEDQFWYFGAEPQPTLTRWGQFFAGPHPFRPIVLSIVALAVAVRLRWRLRGSIEERSIRLVDAGILLVGYGAVSLGSLMALYIPKNVAACYRSLILFALAGLFFASRTSAARGRSRLLLRPRLGRAVLGGVALTVLCGFTRYPTTPSLLSGLLERPPKALHDLQQPRPSITPEWMTDLTVFGEVARTIPHPTVWSTYAGFPEYVANVFHPDTDYIIHALGLERRQRYLEAFDRARPDIVQTELLASFRFEEWLEVTTWPFYERVLRDYVPARLSNYSIFWRRRNATEPAPTFSPPQPLAVEQGHEIAVPIPANTSSRLAVIHLKYTAQVHHRWLPLASKITHFLVSIDGARNQGRVPLNPAATEVTFPLRFAPGDAPVLRVSTKGLWSTGEIQVQEADVSFVEASDAYRAFILGPKAEQSARPTEP
jgi:hypothetical protein